VKTFLSVPDFTADADVSAVFTGGGIGSDDTGTALKVRRCWLRGKPTIILQTTAVRQRDKLLSTTGKYQY